MLTGTVPATLSTPGASTQFSEAEVLYVTVGPGVADAGTTDTATSNNAPNSASVPLLPNSLRSGIDPPLDFPSAVEQQDPTRKPKAAIRSTKSETRLFVKGDETGLQRELNRPRRLSWGWREARPAAAAGGSRLWPVPSDIRYSVRRSSRARRVRVAIVGLDGVEVILPARAPERAAAAAVSELRPWIERRLARARDAARELGRPPGTVPLLGASLALVPERGRVRVHRDGGELLVPAGDAAPALERWYRREARRQIGPRLDHATRLAGTRYESLVIRGQRTRWASCSATGRMSFNWRLLLAPASVLDYVVWHEVCHLEVMDHSARFWRLLEGRWPDYRSDRDWLREYGPMLTLN